MVHVLTREQIYRFGPAPSLLAPIGMQAWNGLAARGHIHAVYTLVGCPAPLAGSWVLVRRAADGHFEALATGFAQYDCASLNLAEIRHLAANLGANEVHLNSSTASREDNAAVASEIAQVEGLEHHVA